MSRSMRTILADARRRGAEPGAPDLSGQWAGESIPELLGDLIEEAETIEPDAGDYVCDEYEEAHAEAARAGS